MRGGPGRVREFFGGDELVLPSADAGEQLNAYYRQRRTPHSPGSRADAGPRTSPAWTCLSSSSRPASPTLKPLASSSTMSTGSISTPTTACARPVRRPGARGRQAVRGRAAGLPRVGDDAPLPLQRLAAAHPDTVDAVFRKILRKRISPGPSTATR